MTVLVVASAQTATPPATASESYVVVTSAEQILGTWHDRTHFLRIDEDGTFREAVGEDALDSMPYAIVAYRFEEAVMLVTGTGFVSSVAPSCGDEVGRYEVRLLESGNLRIVLIEDPCKGRSGNIVRVYEPTESKGYVVVTSAEQVLGTWQYLAARTRFDEDGTFRSAWSANTLESAPYAISSYRFEGGEMLVTELAVSGVPSCGDAVGRYKVWLLENGHLQIVAIGDLCDGRASEMTREYVLTESAGYVVVTSAEQVIGTWWRPAIRYRRFDEDGTFRSASSAIALDATPSAINSYRFEEAVMLVAEVAVSDVPSCGEVVGRYQVRLYENGDLQIVVIEDPCHARAGSTAWVYERVE